MSNELLAKALAAPLPEEVIGTAVDEVVLETLESRMVGFRARLSQGQTLELVEVKTIVEYQRLVRQKAFQHPTNIVKKKKARATKKQQSLSEDEFFAAFEDKK